MDQVGAQLKFPCEDNYEIEGVVRQSMRSLFGLRKVFSYQNNSKKANKIFQHEAVKKVFSI